MLTALLGHEALGPRVREAPGIAVRVSGSTLARAWGKARANLDVLYDARVEAQEDADMARIAELTEQFQCARLVVMMQEVPHTIL